MRRRHGRRRHRDAPLLSDRAYPADEIVPFASERSAGKVLDDGLAVQGLADDERLDGFDVAIFSAGGSISREWAPRFAARGAIVVDNSSAFRMDPDVPLVVSEVNPEALDHIDKGIVANPNCTTMAIMPPLHALHEAFGLTAMVATSFQAAGGAGQKGMDELHRPGPGPARRARRSQTTARAPRRQVEANASSASRWPSTSCRCWAATPATATPTRR